MQLASLLTQTIAVAMETERAFELGWGGKKKKTQHGAGDLEKQKEVYMVAWRHFKQRRTKKTKLEEVFLIINISFSFEKDLCNILVLTLL